MSEYHLSVQDVYNVIGEHLKALDVLWPDGQDMHPPRKVHVVELIDAIKLRLTQVAERNMTRYESPFEKAAKKITGVDLRSQPKPILQAAIDGKSELQTAHEAMRARIRS